MKFRVTLFSFSIRKRKTNLPD